MSSRTPRFHQQAEEPALSEAKGISRGMVKSWPKNRPSDEVRQADQHLQVIVFPCDPQCTLWEPVSPVILCDPCGESPRPPLAGHDTTSPYLSAQEPGCVRRNETPRP